MRSLLIIVTGLIGADVSAGASGIDRWAVLMEKANRLSVAGSIREEEKCLLQALDEAHQFEPNDVRLPQTLGRLGTAAWNLGKHAEAERLYLRALRLWERSEIGDHPEAAATLSCLGTVRRLSGRFREAELLHQQSLSITDRAFGTGSAESALGRKDLASDYYAQGEYEKAVLVLNPAAEVWDRVSPMLRSEMLNALGLAQHGLKRNEEAERLISDALRIRREFLGRGHPKLAESLSNLALIKTSLGEFSEAKPLLEESLRIIIESLGPGHSLEARVREVYAYMLGKMGREKESQDMEQQALAIRHKSGRGYQREYTVDVQELYRNRRN
jgi:tetratricopeptide (TPR) repeat protein